MSHRAAITFGDFSREEYGTFLRAKSAPEFEIILDQDGCAEGISVPARFGHLVGIEVVKEDAPWMPLPEFLFRDQCEIVMRALDAERFACWSDCGLGKTLIELEFARQVSLVTRGRVLIITLNNVMPEIVAEAEKFYGGEFHIWHDLRQLKGRAEVREFCAGTGPAIAVCNYETMNPEGSPETQVMLEMKNLAGLILDESSRLKTGGGKQKWALIKSSKGIRYKLSCTATPAPNEVMEFASQAAFLERIRGESEVIWTYFTRDLRTNEWTVKEHARPHFFRWMASWSIYLREPAAYGWPRAGTVAVPEPVFIEHRISATGEQLAIAREVMEAAGVENAGEMFEAKSLGMVERNQLAQAARGFLYRDRRAETGDRKGEDGARRVQSEKPGMIAWLVEQEVMDGLQVLVWCVFEEEVDILIAELARLGVPAAALGGGDSKRDRGEILKRFREGKLPVLVSKAGMLGFGFNFQFVGSMIFSGLTDSFEAFYQAVRRAFRFGQTRRLRVHLPYVAELEEAILRNVLRKAANFETIIAEQERAYIEAMRELERMEDGKLKMEKELAA